MTVVTYYAIECDNCFTRIVPQGDPGEAYWVAKEMGWRRGDLDLCGPCAAESDEIDHLLDVALDNGARKRRAGSRENGSSSEAAS